MKRVTIKDVALEAGVSLAAVSRVLTKTAGSSARMREKVQKAAKDLGYRPSMLAKGLVGQRTNLITLVSGRMADPFDALFLDRLSERLAQLKMRLLLASSALQGPNESGFFQALDYQSDAVIVSAGTMPLDHSSACVRNGLPVLLMGRIVEQPGVDCALADNGNGA
ncbi:MAG: LacI family transcriptional regulator, partial [Desulfobacterales bacterium]|nr:LacI family transcriptional regulator [Desulfobacterales bacterium]